MSKFSTGDSHTAKCARIGGYRRAALHDSSEMTANARTAFHTKFEQQVDPDGQLPTEERMRRARAAMKAYMTQLAMRRWENERCQSSKSASA